MSYRIEPITDGVWAIDDENEDSLYLIEGSGRAILIDTGASAEPLMPMLRTLTDKPIDLILTHAHIDHMYHAGEFENIYLHRRDLDAWKHGLSALYKAGHILYHLPYRHVDPKKFVPLQDDSVIDPGGLRIRGLPAPGHPPGSSISVAEAHRLLNTGDAFGSGEAAWMWLPMCQIVSKYLESLRMLLAHLESYPDYRYLGGHRLQGVASAKHPHGHPLDIQVPKDMITLCEKMLSGEEEGKPVRLIPILRMRVYGFGHASLVDRLSYVK